MADVLTPAQRSRCMAAIRGKDTKPELAVRSVLYALDYRFRIHRSDLPGKPDIVLPRHSLAIFVHGCFWHMHSCRFGRVVPKTNAAFWASKRQSNVSRDRRNRLALRKLGWRTITIWECQTKDPERLARRLRSRIAALRSCNFVQPVAKSPTSQGGIG